jgi:hypothetical protein
MSRRPIGLLFFALFSPGCVPVTEPVGDIDTAEPDKALVGTWTSDSENAVITSVTVDVPEVKGNPKGLMHATGRMQTDNTSGFWFFTATVGKHTYLSLILDEEGGASSTFASEGAFAKWKKAEKKRYYLIRYSRDGDTVTLDYGNDNLCATIMEDAKVKATGQKPFEFYETPAGWLAKYLDKTGPAKLFDKTESQELKRKKK